MGRGILVKVRMHLLIASIRWDLGYGRFCHWILSDMEIPRISRILPMREIRCISVWKNWRRMVCCPGRRKRFEKRALRLIMRRYGLIRSRILERRLQVSFQMRIMKNLLLRNGCMSTVYFICWNRKMTKNAGWTGRKRINAGWWSVAQNLPRNRKKKFSIRCFYSMCFTVSGWNWKRMWTVWIFGSWEICLSMWGLILSMCGQIPDAFCWMKISAPRILREYRQITSVLQDKDGEIRSMTGSI